MKQPDPSVLYLAILLCCASAPGQTATRPVFQTAAPATKTNPLIAAQPAPRNPPQNRGATALLTSPSSTLTANPALPRTFHDPAWKISFDYPANWTFTRKDGEISTFHLDARSAPHATRLRAVAAIPENPFPASTFSGAYVYLSVTPHSTPAACEAQTAPPGHTSPKGYSTRQIAGISFTHGYDEQKHICTTDRDEIYTTLHRGACYRFDLAMNNFCGGAVSGVKDITAQEIDNVRARMEAILATVRFDPR
jgi:hypothetical protein